MNYSEFTQLINKNREKIASIKAKIPNNPEHKIAAYSQINSILNEQNALIMQRHRVLVSRATVIAKHYKLNTEVKIS